MKILLTTTDDNYSELTRGLITSAIKNEPSFDCFVVCYSGSSEHKISSLESLDDRVNVQRFEDYSSAGTLHDDVWVKNVGLKTRALEVLLAEGHQVVMVDSDCLIMKPIWHSLKDIEHFALCHRDRPALRADMRLDFIASFFFGNGKQALSFVQHWRTILGHLTDLPTFAAPYETPALCLAARDWKPQYISHAPEYLYGAQAGFGDSTKVCHLKSRVRTKLDDVLATRLHALGKNDREIATAFYGHV
jgi:hypothetical protein